MPWNLFILPLVAGYYLLTRFYLFKFKQQRLDTQRLIFESVLLAVCASVVTYLIRVLVELVVPNDIYTLVYRKLPIKAPYIITSFMTLALSVAFTEIMNLFLSEEKYIKNAIKSVGNEFELLLKSSFVDKKLLQITLSNNKVYVAWVKELPIPSISNYIRVIPAMSGYRTEENEIEYTTHYLTVYAEYIEEGKTTDIKDLNVDLIISNCEIVTVSYFDNDMYKRFNKLKKAKEIKVTP